MILHYLKTLLHSLKRQKAFMLLNFSVLIVSMIILTILASTFKELLFTTNINTKGETIYFLKKPIDGFRSYYFTLEEKQKLLKIEVPAKQCITSAYNFSFHPSKNGNLKDFEGYYVNKNLLKLLEVDFISGGRFSQKHIEGDQHVIIINKNVAQYIFGSTDVIGEKILVFDLPHKIVGVYKNMSLASHKSSVAYIPEKFCDYKKMNWNISFIGENLNADVLEKTLNKHSGEFFEDKSDRFQLISQREYFAENLKQFGFLAIFILILALVLPALLMSNIITTRMEAKINELGIRKAFGANRKEIFFQLITENVIITLMGGVVAFIIGLYISSNMLYEEEAFSFGNMLNIPISTHIIIILFYLLFGIISGLYPSRIVAKKSVISSLTNN